MSELIERIKRHEGFKPRVYDDATGQELKAGDTVRGVPTIGHGITWITQEESLWLAQRRLTSIHAELSDRLPFFSELNPVRCDVLVEMAYQMGVEGVLKFHNTLAAVTDGNWDWAAEEMMDSAWARQTPYRAAKLARIMKEGRVA